MPLRASRSALFEEGAGRFQMWNGKCLSKRLASVSCVPIQRGANQKREGDRFKPMGCVIPVTSRRKGAMDWWLNDTLESERVCPFWEQSCCPPTFDSYRQMLAHCRQKHPDKPPFGGDPTTELVMMDNQGKVLSWEEVRRLLDHSLFRYRPKGAVLPREEVA
jgi:hypothetical protein